MGKAKKKADDEEEDEGGGKKKIIMIVGGLVAAGAVYNFVLKKPPPEEAATPEELAAAAEPVEGEIVPMEEMILNLSGEEAGYLKVTLAVVLDDVTLAADFEPELPIAQDVAVQYLSAQSPRQVPDPRRPPGGQGRTVGPDAGGLRRREGGAGPVHLPRDAVRVPLLRVSAAPLIAGDRLPRLGGPGSPGGPSPMDWEGSIHRSLTEGLREHARKHEHHGVQRQSKPGNIER